MSKYFRFLVSLSLVSQSTLAGVCSNWSSTKVGALDTRIVSEASGLVFSQGKLIWSNDSGGAAALHASGEDGRIVRSVTIKNFSNTDFEAMALGPCLDQQNERCIYLGDIGDWIGWRSSFKIGMFKEADFWNATSIAPIRTISYSYPRNAENAEAMVVTPDARIFVFSKSESGVSEVYQLEANARVTQLGSVDLNSILGRAAGKNPLITDAALSADGRRILLLSYGDIVEVKAELMLKPQRGAWRRNVDYSIVKGPGLPQQETITYLSSDSFVVSTEIGDGRSAEIHRYSCTVRNSSPVAN